MSRALRARSCVVGGSSVTVYTIDCGSAIYGGPDDFTSGGVWLIDPCAEVVRDRRLLAGAGFVVAVGSVALFATARPPREGPTVGRG